MKRLPLVSLSVLLVTLPACDDDGEPAGSSGTGSTMSTPQQPPTNPDALLSWLQGDPYLDWAAESAIHGSTGPHFGQVRTWVNDLAIAGLGAGATELEVGAATVKELYGDGQTRRGWSVSVKTEAGSSGDGWYWYEYYDDSVLADAQGLTICVSCHEAGVDYVLTPFPLQ